VEANRTLYDSLDSVDAYTSMVDLKKPEQTILNLLKTKSPFKRMLDIGVGTGRTTSYFSEIAEEYIGIDYSKNMIKVCREKFEDRSMVSFGVVDARNLPIYEDNFFDFVLFSHGGLDSVEHEDRLRILHEIWRTSKNGGYFCFSTSNLNAMLKFCRIRLSKHPKVIARNVLQILLIRLTNQEMWGYVRGKRNNTTHTMFKIGGNDWGLKTYCITPEAQVSQLKDAGFDHIQIYDLQGKEIATVTNTADIELYYLSKVAKFH